MAASRPPRRLLLAAALALAVAAVFWPILGHDFVNYDDDEYVTGNPWVQQGLSREALRWAWSSGHIYWQPLTWMSHMLDWELFGRAAGGHHAVSLALHAANTVLVFVLLERTTGAIWRSALVAALFGVHPLRVESVAWAAERKDVLSTFFWLLTTQAYVAWARRPAAWRYALVLLGLALGLMAKPMLVTLPCTLLLLDYWPLGRLRRTGDLWPRVREKLPLVPLVVASITVTLALASDATIGSLASYALRVRIENAIVSYVAYLGMTLWPHDLAVLYLHPGDTIPSWKVAAAALLLAALTAAVLRARRARPALAVGWLWYLGTLVPVIGLLQAGEQGMADRFTYVPLLGIFVAVAWALPPWPRLVPALAAAVLVALVVRTRAQLPVWQDAATLFGHAVAIEPDNPIAQLNLGVALAQQGTLEEAGAHYERALRLRPRYASVVNALGDAALDAGRPDRALAHYTAVVRAVPDDAVALNDAGRALARAGDAGHALTTFEAAVRADPRNTDALNNLGAMLIAAGRAEDGLGYIERALAVRPDLGRAHANRALGLVALGRWAEAAKAVEEARARGTEPAAAVLAALREHGPPPAAP